MFVQPIRPINFKIPPMIPPKEFIKMQPVVTDTVTFGFSHSLKTHWYKGDFPTVTHGLYGDRLTQYNVSLEHLVPKSKGGHTELYNLALASKHKNNKRGTRPLRDVLTIEQADAYLDQFTGIRLADFNGDKYKHILHNKIKRLIDDSK